MTDVKSAPPSVEDEDRALKELRSRYRSERGPFEIYTAPPLAAPPTPDAVGDDAVAAAVDVFEYSELVDDDHPEAAVRASLAEMIRAISPGNIVTPLFSQDGEQGMSLVHAWFGPHFPLFRHSHPRFGDCLYYVVAGQVVMGSRVLNPGDGFFVPNGMPYKYQAGPEGVEVLEFRAGGGVEGAAVIKLHEPSIEALDRLTAAAVEHHADWTDPPARVADVNRRSGT
jgi:hypothetical protein